MAIHPPKPKALPKRPSWASPYHGARMSEEEYLALPEEKPYLEYVDGVVLQKPMPTPDHWKLSGEVTYYFGVYKRSHGGHYGPEARVRMGETGNHRLPDTGYWRAGTSTGVGDPPTLAVEVRSPDQSLNELRAKCRQFLAHGAEVCWLIDPRSRTAEVFDAEHDGAPIGTDGTLESAALPGLALSLPGLWAVLDEE